MTGTAAPAGLAPAPGAAPLPRMLAAQTRLELTLTARRGESVLLTLVIPVLLLTVFTTVPVLALPHPRVDFLVPGVLALAVLSTAFTGQAIATGFERQYGVLRRLGTTALPRWALLVAKTGAVLAVEVVQVGVVALVGLLLGWAPHGSPLLVAALLLFGTAAFSGLGLLLAGTLRAEATLAAANLVYLLLLVVGGVAFPVHDFPAPLRAVVGGLPVTALSDGLRAVLQRGAGVPAHDWVVLAAWTLGAGAAAARTFRWE